LLYNRYVRRYVYPPIQTEWEEKQEAILKILKNFGNLQRKNKKKTQLKER
jgi:hypothetical protein